MRGFVIGLVFWSVIAATGCGTVGNVFGPREYPHAYGGVEYDWLALQGTWLGSKPEEPTATQAVKSVGSKLLLTGLIAIDFPLSFVGDTITLPNVLLQSGFQNSSWDLGKNKVPMDNFSHETILNPENHLER